MPYEALAVADVGDVPVRMYSMEYVVEDIRNKFRELMSTGCKTLAMGGDHTITYPILQAVKVRLNSLIKLHQLNYNVDLYMPTCNFRAKSLMYTIPEDYFYQGCIQDFGKGEEALN